LKARSTYQIMQDIKAADISEKEKLQAKNLHPETLRRVFDMQQEQVPCIKCNKITKTDVHVEYRTGIAVFTKYVCPHCKHEFMEKDLHE
jgi:hypothetical protein